MICSVFVASSSWHSINTVPLAQRRTIAPSFFGPFSLAFGVRRKRFRDRLKVSSARRSPTRSLGPDGNLSLLPQPFCKAAPLGSRRSARCAKAEGREELLGGFKQSLPAAALSSPCLSEEASAAVRQQLLCLSKKQLWKMASYLRRRCRLLLHWLFFSHLGCLCYYKAYGIIVKTDNEHVTAKEFEGAFLSCKHNARKETTTRVEWKKVKGSDVTFVYFNGFFVVPPAAPVCEVPISAMTGTVVELRCKETEGVPASKYRWYRNGIILLENPLSGHFKKRKFPYTLNTTTGTLLFNPVSKNDTGEYYCEAYNRIGRPQKCPVKRMQVDDLNVSAIIAAVIIVALIMASCGLGVYYAQKKGYFSKRNSSVNNSSKSKATESKKDFKHTKSFVI